MFTQEWELKVCVKLEHNADKMPLFGKKDNAKKSKKEGKDAEKTPTVEDKYNLKELLGTWVNKY